MSVKCRDIMNLVYKKAPAHLAMEFDNIGLQIGDENAEIKSVLVALDIDCSVIDEAVDSKCELIISHHPVIFSPLKSIKMSDFKGKIIHSIITKQINVFTAHTNLDIATSGINDYLAEKLDLDNIYILDKTYQDILYKLSVYVPEGYENKVREAITNAGAGHIGNYSECTFNIKGQGMFKPLSHSKPFIGEAGIIEHVKEIKIETVVYASMLQNVIEMMLEVHPYELPAYDINPVSNNSREFGIGRIGYLKSPLSLYDFCSKIKDILEIKNLSVVGELNKIVNKVALCSGSGADLIVKAFNSGCDAYITGDLDYHDACDARDMGIALIDAGHFETEFIYMENLVNYLKDECLKHKYNVNIVLSMKNKNPFIKV